MRPDLVTLRIAMSTTPVENVARELACCVREDGEPIEQVGARAGLPVEIVLGKKA